VNLQTAVISSEAIKARARALGFDLCGIAPATALPELTRLAEWLERGYAGEMRYLQTSAETRADIRRFLPSAQSVIVTATNYYVDRPGAAAGDETNAHIARYAWGEDYHIVLAERLAQLVAWIGEQTAEPFESRIFVDKHHVQERAFARRAGLGWIGKNTLLINRELGSYTFLAGVAVSVPLEPDGPVDEGCGSCTICIDACPTGALVDEYELDATRCISYLTIEHKGPIPERQRPLLGHHVYGCDVCQDVCPYNVAPLSTLDPAWQPKAGRADSSPLELWERSDHELHAVVRESAMTRVSLSRLRRNLAVALGNSGDGRAATALERPGAGVRRAAQSADTELVREHVTWAKEALGVR
jgi:epoxyqueuosine reductase